MHVQCQRKVYIQGGDTEGVATKAGVKEHLNTALWVGVGGEGIFLNSFLLEFRYFLSLFLPHCCLFVTSQWYAVKETRVHGENPMSLTTFLFAPARIQTKAGRGQEQEVD